MASGPLLGASASGHGNIFARELGSMIVHVQREAGLAHRTFVFRPWQVQVIRVAASRWTWLLAVVTMASWAFLASQAVQVPLLNTRIARMERDALRLDTLQLALKELQERYEQVQSMLSRPASPAAPRSPRVPDQKP